MESKNYYTGNINPQGGVYPFFFEDNTCFRYTDKTNNSCKRQLQNNKTCRTYKEHVYTNDDNKK